MTTVPENKKRQRIVKKHIPDFIYIVSANMINEGVPEKYCNPNFIHTVFRKCCAEMGNELVNNVSRGEDNWVEAFGWGKFGLHEGTGYKRRKKGQYYLAFKNSPAVLARMRQRLGTATPAELKEIEKSEKFLESVSSKRTAFMESRNEKRKAEKAAAKQPPAVTRYAEILGMNLD